MKIVVDDRIRMLYQVAGELVPDHDISPEELYRISMAVTDKMLDKLLPALAMLADAIRNATSSIIEWYQSLPQEVKDLYKEDSEDERL